MPWISISGLLKVGLCVISFFHLFFIVRSVIPKEEIISLYCLGIIIIWFQSVTLISVNYFVFCIIVNFCKIFHLIGETYTVEFGLRLRHLKVSIYIKISQYLLYFPVSILTNEDLIKVTKRSQSDITEMLQVDYSIIVLYHLG